MWFSHKTTHTRKLSNLISRSTSTRVKHHIYCIESLVCLCHMLHHTLLKVIVNMCPSINHLIVTFLIGDETHFVVSLHLINLILSLTYNVFLFYWDYDIIQVKR